MLFWLSMAASAAGFDALMMGNSYTNANNLSEGLAEDLGHVPAWSGASVTSISAAGYTWEDHLDVALNQPMQGMALEELDQTYDVVILQEQSQIPGFDQSSADFGASETSLLGLDAMAAELGAETLLLMTWGRRAGDPANPDLYPDFPTMQDHIDAGYLAYSEALQTIGRDGTVAPVGRAFRALHDQDAEPGSPFWMLYAEDGSHPSPYGTFLAQTVLYTTLSGRDPTRLPIPSGVEGLDPEILDLLRRTARDVVLDDAFGDLSYPWAMPWLQAAQGGDEVRIGAAGMRPVVRITDAASAKTVRIGVEDGVLPGDGELRIDGGSLAVDELVVGSAGEGWLAHRAGDVNVEMAVVAESGRWIQSGGTLTARSLVGHLEQDGGRLAVWGPTSLDRWSMGPDAEMSVRPGTGLVVVSGDAVLAGTVVLDACTEGPIVKRLDAADIDATALRLEGCADARLAVTSSGVDVVIDSVAAPPTEPVRVDPQSGCATAPIPAGWGAGLVLLLLARPRR